jgi:hypothetical protein
MMINPPKARATSQGWHPSTRPRPACSACEGPSAPGPVVPRSKRRQTKDQMPACSARCWHPRCSRLDKSLGGRSCRRNLGRARQQRSAAVEASANLVPRGSATGPPVHHLRGALNVQAPSDRSALDCFGEASAGEGEEAYRRPDGPARQPRGQAAPLRPRSLGRAEERRPPGSPGQHLAPVVGSLAHTCDLAVVL